MTGIELKVAHWGADYDRWRLYGSYDSSALRKSGRAFPSFGLGYNVETIRTPNSLASSLHNDGLLSVRSLYNNYRPTLM